MSNPRVKYAVDRDAEAAGAPVVIDDMQFIVRSASAANRGYRYALAIAAGKRREELRSEDGRAAFEVHEQILIEAFSDSVILGWTGVENGDGHALEFNRENCISLMEDCPNIWDAIRDAALDANRFRPAAQEDGEQLGKS